MISQFWIRQCQEGGRKEHGLVIGMRNEKTYALVAQFGEAAARNVDGIQPGSDGDNGKREEREPLHDCIRVGAVEC